MKHINISEKFNIIEQTIEQDKTKLKPININTNFMVVIDASGSMSGDLPLIRTQLKNKLPNLLRDGDTITIVWFSGKNEAGVLKEAVEIRNITNLQTLNEAIDKWLRPIGLTAFAKPLDLVKESIDRIKITRPDSVFAMLFMSDGYNNDCSWSDVKKSLANLQDDIVSATFVEYGHYADSEKLSEMAELIGGEKISTSSFDEYDIAFDNKLTNIYSSAKKISVKSPVPTDDLMLDFAFTVTDNNEVISFTIKEGEVLCWDNVEKLYFFSKIASGNELRFTSESQTELAKMLYSAIYLLTDRTLNTEVELIYSVLGDKHTFDVFTNAFGKQKLNDYKNIIKECVTDENKRFVEGKVDGLVQDENAYCIMDFIETITEFDDNLMYPSHPDFNYNRIGRKRVSKQVEVINDEIRAKLASVTNIQDLDELVTEIKNNGADNTILKFVYREPNKGYAMSNLVWNSSRANLSVTIKIDGYIELPANSFGLERVETFQYRNFTLIKDGILNITKLPVTLNPITLNKIVAHVNVVSVDSNGIMTIDISKLPIINRSMVREISANRLAELEVELLRLQANKKVYDYYDKQLFPKESKGFVDKYGKECEDYLKQLGITEYNGYSPKTEFEESNDFYYAVTLDTKVSGYSTLPKVIDVEVKLQKDGTPVLKPTEQFLAYSINDYLRQVNSELYLTQDDVTRLTILSTWLKTSKNKFISRKREVMQEIAKIKFSLILSKKWFKEFKNFDDNILSVDIDGKSTEVKFVLSEEQVKC